ncbi:MAG: DEAD/DEAH box helicase [Verrucomicrobiales bacterium]|jgi:superfamily II DNA/RNA helicase|nr:DEAD/DEAH box helicase [Verrucomicrobiales bacterium]
MRGGFEILQNLVLPDAWQAEAIQHLRRNRDVIISAPTGAGKTFVFEKYIESANLQKQAVYSVPTRALANDKFAEWKNQGWRVGIITGDITIDPDAPVVVGTLEALQHRILRSNRVGLLVVDEYQWLGNFDRGNHYEGLLLAAPPHVRLLLMSGCIANPQEVAEWLQRLGRDVAVVSHKERPVPLEEVNADYLAKRAPSSIEGFWTRRLASALRDNLGPVLVFAPHRREAERIARQAARELPPCEPLAISDEQKALLTPELGNLLRLRVAYHHSGLTYSQRAGIIEPLAKAGQLRVVVATLGLSSGINFSLRSVMITARRYSIGGIEQEIQPHDLLQMIGRAGRRGLDETGYYLVSQDTPRMNEAQPMRLKRATPLPWSFILNKFINDSPHNCGELEKVFFSRQNIPLGCHETSKLIVSELPCKLATDTGRTRLVRRKQRPFKPCKQCPQRPHCLELDPAPTLLWQWQKIGILDKTLNVTPRGRIVSYFATAEGLAIGAALEDDSYHIQDLIIDLANLFSADRFAGNEPRWSGRLALACQKAYGRFSIDGYLQWGVPPQYGYGANDVLRELLNKTRRKGQLTGEHSGIGDIDRLLTEWLSLLNQITHANTEGPPRWQELQSEARQWLTFQQLKPVLTLPPLIAEQKKPVNHRISWR